MNSLNIRIIEAQDTERVIELWHQCGLVVPWNDPRSDINRKRAYQAEFFLVAEDDFGKIIGSVMGGYDGHRGSVNYIAVDPGFRNQGVGKLLIDELSNKLEGVGCPRIKLLVRQADIESTGFLQATGFVQDDVLAYGRRLISD